MRLRFQLDHRHYHHMDDPEVAFVVKMRSLGAMSTAEMVVARTRADILEWLKQYPRTTWDIRHQTRAIGSMGEYLDSHYWFCTDDDDLAMMFKLAWM